MSKLEFLAKSRDPQHWINQYFHKSSRERKYISDFLRNHFRKRIQPNLPHILKNNFVYPECVSCQQSNICDVTYLSRLFSPDNRRPQIVIFFFLQTAKPFRMLRSITANIMPSPITIELWRDKNRTWKYITKCTNTYCRRNIHFRIFFNLLPEMSSQLMTFIFQRLPLLFCINFRIFSASIFRMVPLRTQSSDGFDFPNSFVSW